MFAALFACYAVLRGNTFGGQGARSFLAALLAWRTMILLTSSFTCGLAMLALIRITKTKFLLGLGLRFCLAFIFNNGVNRIF